MVYLLDFMLIQWCCQRRATQEVRASYLECQEDISDLKAYLEETRIADGVLALCSWIAMVQEATLQISCKMGPHGASLQVEGGLPLFACLLMFRLNVPPHRRNTFGCQRFTGRLKLPHTDVLAQVAGLVEKSGDVLPLCHNLLADPFV